jgi:uncharacterized protein YyaL (SSP411 family)
LVAEALLIAAPLAPVAGRPRGSSEYAALAEATLGRGSVLLAKLPRSAGHWLAVAAASVAGPVQIAVAQPGPEPSDLLRRARVLAPGGAVVVGGTVDSAPLLEDRPPVNGQPAAYVCRGQVCGLPVTSADALADQLASTSAS